MINVNYLGKRDYSFEYKRDRAGRFAARQYKVRKPRKVVHSNLWNYLDFPIRLIFFGFLLLFTIKVLQTAPSGIPKVHADTASPTPVVSEIPKNDPESIIQSVFGKDAPIMLKIARCESGIRKDATNKNKNGTQDRGVFQINSNTWPGYTDIDYNWAYDAKANILVAKKIFDARGTQPWYSSEKCWGKN